MNAEVIGQNGTSRFSNVKMKVCSQHFCIMRVFEYSELNKITLLFMSLDLQKLGKFACQDYTRELGK